LKCEQLVAAFAGTNPNKSQALSAADIVKVEATSTLSIKFFESLTATVLFKCSISLLYHFCITSVKLLNIKGRLKTLAKPIPKRAMFANISFLASTAQ
jgi:predicted neuraminidase